ncbi:MAG: hypothetical protein E6R03_02220 [Hyphomicrobiaceae bacterium]|nr:MAG: hypothetical protein E6R03_02220 [Hyphomicrobiaceae bacterium]
MPESPFQRFTVSGVIADFLRALTGGTAAAQIGVPTTTEMDAAVAARMPKLLAGRALSDNDAVVLSDYGTYVALNGHLLQNGTASYGNILAVSGPGSVLSDNLGEVLLQANESALLTSDNAGNLILLSTGRSRGCIRTAGDTAPSGPLDGDEWFDTSTKRSMVYSDEEWVEQPASTTLEGFVHADGNSFDSAVDGTSLGTGNTLVLRGSEGQAAFVGTSANALTGTYTSSSTSTDKAGVFGTTNAIGAFGIRGVHTSTTGWGATGHAETGLGGVLGTAGSGTGVQGTSTSGSGGKFKSSSGTYHAEFGDSGNDRVAISRVRGWIVWFYGLFTGKLQTDNITGNRTWVLPDASGTLMLEGTVDSSDITDATALATANKVVIRDADGSAAFNSLLAEVLKISGGDIGLVLGYSAEAEGFIPMAPVYGGKPSNAVEGTGGTPGFKGRMAVDSSGKAYICTQEDYTEANTGWVALVTSSTL